MNFKDKVVLITGAGSGIGRELVMSLLARGSKIIASDINEASLEETKKLAGNMGDRVSIHVLDVADKTSVDVFPEMAMKIFGQVDAVINNAGIIQPFVKINELDYEAINRVMNINFYGTLFMTKAFLPILLKRPEAYIANVSSMGGFLPVPGQSVYGASKAAVKLFTEGLSAELADTNVHVSVVFPGATKTNITKNSGLKEPKMEKNEKQKSFPMLSAKEASEIILKGMENNSPRILVGSDSKFMDKIYRLNPVFAKNFIAKKMKSLLN